MALSGRRAEGSRLRTDFVFSHLLLALCAGQKFSCSSTKDSAGKDLNTVLAPELNEDWCENRESTKDIGSLMDMCQGFCGETNIPYLVGLPTYGFNLQEIDSICLRQEETDSDSAFLRYDPELSDNCKVWSRSLSLIQMRAADFVAAIDNMTYAQMVFRQGMAVQIQKIVDVISSDQTRETMMNVIDSERLPTYLGILQAHLQEFLSGGKLRGDLQATMETLSTRGSKLQQTLSQHLPSLRKYFEQCSVLLLATSPSREYLIDLCNQRSPRCLAPDDVDAKHVGCCCGNVPISGSLGLTGESAGRRLEQEVELVDVCGEAEIIFKDRKEALEKTLQESTHGQNLLASYKSKLKDSYPEFDMMHLSQCAGGGRRLEGEAEASLPADGTSTANLRRLQKLATCDPQLSTMNTSETLRVAFWKDTETDYCNKISDTAGLADTCKAFCGDSAVPLMIGTTAFGFNQSSMDSVCGAHDEPLRADFATVAKCHDDAKALNVVETKAAAFISKLDILEAEKIRYEAQMKATVKTMKESIKSKAADIINDAEVGKKIDALRGLLKQETAPLTSGSSGLGARFFLQQATDAVQTAGDDLSAELERSLAKLDHLVTSCSQLFTGVGSDREYLLDLCSQTSTQCIESTSGRHVGCCCGYAPMLTLGLKSIPGHTIPGLSHSALGDPSSRARVAAQTRRMQASKDGVYHVCAESERLAESAVQEAEGEVKALGYEYLLEQAKAAKASKYPGYYCEAASACDVETGGTCRLFGCDSSRGSTDCKDGRCVCAEGYCLEAGKCTKKAEHTSGCFRPLPGVLLFVFSAVGLLTWQILR